MGVGVGHVQGLDVEVGGGQGCHVPVGLAVEHVFYDLISECLGAREKANNVTRVLFPGLNSHRPSGVTNCLGGWLGTSDACGRSPWHRGSGRPPESAQKRGAFHREPSRTLPRTSPAVPHPLPQRPHPPRSPPAVQQRHRRKGDTSPLTPTRRPPSWNVTPRLNQPTPHPSSPPRHPNREPHPTHRSRTSSTAKQAGLERNPQPPPPPRRRGRHAVAEGLDTLATPPAVR